VPGTRKEPQFTVRSDYHTEPAAPSPVEAPKTPEPSTPWARSDENRYDAPTNGRTPWENSAVWLVLTGIAISVSAFYLVYAAIVAPIPPPSSTDPTVLATPSTFSPARPLSLPAAPDPALPPPAPVPATPDPLPVSKIPSAPAPKPAAPVLPSPSPVIEAPAHRPADRPERFRPASPRPAIRHAPPEALFAPDANDPPARNSDRPPIDARDLPPPDAPLGPPPPER
jgi:hypothetical protein